MGDILTWIYHSGHDSHSVGVFQVGACVEEKKSVFTELSIIISQNMRVSLGLGLHWHKRMGLCVDETMVPVGQNHSTRMFFCSHYN